MLVFKIVVSLQCFLKYICPSSGHQRWKVKHLIFTKFYLFSLLFTWILKISRGCMMHVITFARALVHVISCIIHVVSFGRALAHVISCIMHVIKFEWPLVHVISWIIHVMSFGQAIVHVISCIMQVITFERPLVHVIIFGRTLVMIYHASCMLYYLGELSCMLYHVSYML